MPGKLKQTNTLFFFPLNLTEPSKGILCCHTTNPAWMRGKGAWSRYIKYNTPFISKTHTGQATAGYKLQV